MRLITKSPAITRRALLAGATSIAALSLLPVRAFAITASSAEGLIHNVVADVLKIINSGDSESRMLADFNDIFVDYGEVPLIAKTALGAPGRTVSSSQLSAYIKAFEGYISRKYGRQFRTFAGADMTVVSNRDAGTRGFLVRTMMKVPGRANFEVEWWVIDINGRPKFFDMKIEGISLISTERTEIGALLESLGGDINKLIAKLNAS